MCLNCHSTLSETKICKCKNKVTINESIQVGEEAVPTCYVSCDGYKILPREPLSDENANKTGLQSLQFTDEGKKVGACSQMTIGSYENKTKILNLINGGSFGHIYLGQCLSTNKLVAVKAEKQGTGSEKLLQEGNVYYKLQGGPGIPKVYWYGMHGSQFNFLVMELLGPSLAELFHLSGEHFSLPTVLKLIVKMLNVIQFVHKQDLLHRDISPDNFVMRQEGKQQQLYLIDFGLAKKCNTAGQMILPRKGRYGFQFSRPLVGTPRFASLGVHQGAEEGRRDDLESLAYMTIYFLKGSLPWQGSNTSSETLRFAEIAECKARLSAADLCDNIPAEFATFLDYTRSLRPNDIPDYNGLIDLFSKRAATNSIDLDSVVYDWENRNS